MQGVRNGFGLVFRNDPGLGCYRLVDGIMWQAEEKGSVFVLLNKFDSLGGQPVAEELALGAILQHRVFVWGEI